MHISEMQSKIDKKPPFFEVKVFEVVLRKSGYYDGSIWYRDSTS